MNHRKRSSSSRRSSSGSEVPPLGEMRDLLKQKAHGLFTLCDKEDKGFATKRDMYRLEGQLPLTPQQLDEVFDALDKDGNGCLTLREFTEGLGMFLGVECQLFQDDCDDVNGKPNDGESLPNDKLKEDEEDDDEFDDFLDSFGAQNVFTDEEYIRHMWDRVRKDDPSMFQNFQNLLKKITQELKNKKNEYSSLENTLKNRANDHEEQVQALYNEMEEQIKAEKVKLISEERLKEQQRREDLELELERKNTELLEMASLHFELERKLRELNACESEKKHENVKLQKERDTLERKLVDSEHSLDEMKNQMESLKKKSLEERRNRAKAALKVSEGIALERETLAQQLCDLKKMNLKLLDEKDELENTVSTTPLNVTDEEDSSSTETEDTSVKFLTRNGSTSEVGTRCLKRYDAALVSCNHPVSSPVSKSSSSCCNFQRTKLHRIKEIPSSSSLPEDDETSSQEQTQTSSFSHPLQFGPSLDEDCEVDDEFYGTDPPATGSKSDVQNNLNRSPATVPKKTGCNLPDNVRDDDDQARSHPSKTPNRVSTHKLRRRYAGRSMRRMECHEARSLINDSHKQVNDQNFPPVLTPDRIFKIVFVGDSGVGKSSFIHRFCSDTFKPTFSATVGLDFQVKTVNVEGRISALKIWDTAGQERFRSMTVQYFRHADGIVVLYDVTSETSFKNIRNWIFQVKEGVCENVVIMVIGNKTDLCRKDEDRVIRKKDGMKLAEEFEALFFETSAKTGDRVEESMDALSRLLQKKEDQILQQVVRLQESENAKKKKCC